MPQLLTFSCEKELILICISFSYVVTLFPEVMFYIKKQQIGWEVLVIKGFAITRTKEDLITARNKENIY